MWTQQEGYRSELFVKEKEGDVEEDEDHRSGRPHVSFRKIVVPRNSLTNKKNDI